MAFQSIRLMPGVDVVKTPTLIQLGITSANMIRWREGLPEKIGGWVRFYPFVIGSIPRALHAWEDLNSVAHLAIGATAGLLVITNGVLSTITPQITTTNTPPIFQATSGSNVITIIDSNISNPTVNNFVFLGTPVSVGGQVLQGLYPIVAVLSADSYQIDAAVNSTLSSTTSTVTFTAGSPGVVNWTAHGLVANAPVYFTTSGTLPAALTANKTYYVSATGLATNSFEVSAVPGGTPINFATAGTGTQSAFANYGTVPVFTATSGSAVVNVYEPNHGQIVGANVAFQVPTTVDGLVISGTYLVQGVADANNFSIVAASVASSSVEVPMNGGNVEFVYYIAIGPQPASNPYGSGNYGAGAYGTGATGGAGTGTPITALDWTLGNWGEILLACPEGGGIYQWRPDSGFQTAQLVSGTSPISNTGMFVAQPEQILVAFGSSFTGVPQPLAVNWTTVGDFTVWTPLITNQAGGYTIPTGSRIVGGLQAPQQGLIWTDIDVYSMQYVGPPNVFGFTKIMAGCGLIGLHAAGLLGNTVYWMSGSPAPAAPAGQGGQFFMMPAGGAPVSLPCTVWDFIFQNLDTTNAYKIRCRPNSNFNTIAWEFPSKSGGSGEPDMFVEYNPVEGEWVTGQYPNIGRSAWIDQSIFGPPIGGTPSQLIYQHEIGYDADGAPITAQFTTGYFPIGEGEDFYMIDQVVPDFKYNTVNGSQSANVLLTVFAVPSPNGPQMIKGPYTVTSTSNPQRPVTTRVRGRQAAFTAGSADLGSWWRAGLVRYRYGLAGRR